MARERSINRIRIATRQSALALWQAEYVQQALQKIDSKLVVELVGLTTQGDKWLEAPLYDIGGKGLFVKELEDALLTKNADIAVHSLKDMLTVLPDGLMLAAIMEREDSRDVLIANKYNNVQELPQNAKVGTSSLRRQAQIKQLRPDLNTLNLRGNVPTRIDKLDNDEFDAIILAAAGIKRLQQTARIKHYFSIDEILPAAGQGAICIECRTDDIFICDLLAQLNHQPTRICVEAERAVIHHLGGNCKTPIAAFAKLAGNTMHLSALVASPDGKLIIREQQMGAAENAELLGKLVAENLLAQGADNILNS